MFRFCNGLKALGVLHAIQAHPNLFHDVLCYQPMQMNVETFEGLFDVNWSIAGTQNRSVECRIMAYWKLYLEDIAGNFVCVLFAKLCWLRYKQYISIMLFCTDGKAIILRGDLFTRRSFNAAII